VSTVGPPIVEGWFTDTDQPALLALRCDGCAATVFPPRATTCPNPACRSDELSSVELNRTGTVWSWAVNHYPPPSPYVAPDPFEPYTVVAVALNGEDLTVLGQLVNGDPADLAVGTPVEVTATSVLEDDGGSRAMYGFRVVSQPEHGGKAQA
jgi:uncharacterized protein